MRDRRGAELGDDFKIDVRLLDQPPPQTIARGRWNPQTHDALTLLQG